ncbi:hypothetical protein CP532_0774 [Ophiocordyceps camponoti-leonardi (nom. inval.)]|nr:hypothetical protein CP532_0774 [Ophiocordyceps camponoti-leonardi (nom. inval.)]
MFYNRWAVFLLSIAALLFFSPAPSYAAPPGLGLGGSRGSYNVNSGSSRSNPGSSSSGASGAPRPGAERRPVTFGRGGALMPFSTRPRPSDSGSSSSSSSSSRGSPSSGRNGPPSFDDAVFPGRNPGPPPDYSRSPPPRRFGPPKTPPSTFDPPPPYGNGKDSKGK